MFSDQIGIVGCPRFKAGSFCNYCPGTPDRRIVIDDQHPILRGLTAHSISHHHGGLPEPSSHQPTVQMVVFLPTVPIAFSIKVCSTISVRFVVSLAWTTEPLSRTRLRNKMVHWL